ncbi:MAG TPA: hypothetical protein VH639_05950 [Bryobacteraceae bacterium]|jgi:polysaccharide chain length determinant protein (PEP-CTERM system associated)
MQPTDGFSVPRRTLDVEDYIDIVRRHRGWIFGPFLFVLVGTVVGAYRWPDSYVSEATVKVQPQQVPQNMVQSAINQAMTDRIGSMSQTILSRTTLTTIINNFNLYPRERKNLPIEDVVELMRKKIEIQPVLSVGGPGHEVPAFKIQFTYENRLQVQRVVGDLLSRFLDENIRSRANATFLTEQFMKDEVDQAKKKLDDVESKLTEFKVQNNGRLPDQADANMRQLQALEASSTYLSNSMSRASQEKLELEGGLRIVKDEIADLNKQPKEVVTPKRDDRLDEVDKEIEQWKTQLTALRQRFTESYPDVRAAALRLDAAQKKRQDIVKEDAAKKPEAPALPPVNLQAQRDARELSAAMQRTQGQIEAKDLEVQEYGKELKSVNDRIKLYQGRLETAPVGEKQYGDLMRERDIAKQNYEDLDTKLSRAKIAKEMEDRKQGEILEELDPPSLPTAPTEPKRGVIVSLGAGIGLLIGFVVAGAREMKDSSLKNLKDVRAYTQMPVLGSIPLLENDFVVRRRRRLAWLGWTMACLASAVVISGSILYHWVANGRA